MGATLKDKVIVITGASSGAGRAISNALAKEGASLVLAARSEEALQEVALECRELGGGQTLVVPTDTRSAASMEGLARRSLTLNGRLFAWINNAGVMVVGSLEQVPANIAEEVIRTNLIGYINGAKASLPIFKKQDQGILINNISVGGWLPTPYATAYSASKFGVRGFSEALKGELKSFPNINVVDLYPGFLDTPGLQHAGNYTGKVIKPAATLGDPRSVADAVVKLLIDPKSRKTIGFPSAALRLSYALLPALTRNTTGRMISKYLNHADPTAPTQGNIMEPVAYGTSIDGGWRKPMSTPVKIAASALFVTVGLTAFFLTSNFKKTVDIK
ncbi:MAG: SDR family oxidoreductase [Flavitalea sp.]